MISFVFYDKIYFIGLTPDLYNYELKRNAKKEKRQEKLKAAQAEKRAKKSKSNSTSRVSMHKKEADVEFDQADFDESKHNLIVFLDTWRKVFFKKKTAD